MENWWESWCGRQTEFVWQNENAHGPPPVGLGVRHLLVTVVLPSPRHSAFSAVTFKKGQPRRTGRNAEKGNQVPLRLVNGQGTVWAWLGDRRGGDDNCGAVVGAGALRVVPEGPA